LALFGTVFAALVAERGLAPELSGSVFAGALGSVLAAPLAAKTNFDSTGSIKPVTCRFAEA
jgi:hypothetical protein